MAENKLSVDIINVPLVTQCKRYEYKRIKPVQLAICWKIIIDDNANQCPICWEPITDHKTTECNHTMCTKCLDKWLESNNSCPICRMKIQNHTHPSNALPQIPIQVFASNYNVFRIMSGLGGLSYSS
jgi:hypothetical protein